MTILIQSRPSNGATALREAINAAGVRCLRRRHGATSRLRRSSFLVNWGCSNLPLINVRQPDVNHYKYVAAAVDKAQTFANMQTEGVSIPKYTTTPPSVDVNVGDSIWLERWSVSGSGGSGITVVRPDDKWSDGNAPLYVQYIPKLVEFRVHAFRILDDVELLVRQKLRESNVEQTRDQRLIRNRDNGWVFGLERDAGAANLAKTEAIKAIKALNLDFGAVDVIIGRDDGKAYVLEVNTAPGLEAEPVIEFYRDSIISRYDLWRDHDRSTS